MFYAFADDHSRIRAEPRRQALCPTCSGPVRAKCGRIVTWHWAHVERECDPFSEPMTEWHRQWQDEVPEACREYVIGPHRADILAPAGFIVELQHSSISPDEIETREAFYQRMAWVFDVREAAQTKVYKHDEYGNVDSIDTRLSVRGKNRQYSTFRWRHPRKSIAQCKKPVFLDLGDDLLYLQKIHISAPCGGWGYLIARDALVGAINGDTPDLANHIIRAAS